MKRFIAAAVLLFATSVAWALPSLQDVETQVRQGNYAQAETMMSEVVAAKPDSARARYIYAEVLARNGHIAKASTEAARARELDPKIGFTDPAKFESFERELRQAQSTGSTSRAATPARAAPSMAVQPAEARQGMPSWIWLVVLLGIGAVMWRLFTRNRGVPTPGGGEPYTAPPSAGMSPGPYGPAGPQGQNYGPGYGPTGGVAAPAPGGGLLRTGLAVGAGVAGGMLLDRMLHQDANAAGVNQLPAAGAAGGFGNLGGADPDAYNPAADQATRDLENRPVDFGNGGDDWGSGGDSGSFDSGSGGSDDW